ncbi:FtsK/SpoIIIE family protein [Terrimicrobium sacchariphilum]|uniref:FtsK/SpoIIIE family protein n=1 Tax=Terrimicrobium sacchariphilum TaxID=690879 RepID=A0A146GFP9_TERSA|nr:FtsK/SpoIIIE family protein [Terrimicrobium sacchariphilum]
MQRSLALVKYLKAVTEEFAQKESALLREISARRVAETRKFREEQARLENWLAAETALADTRFQERKGEVEHRAALREARIRKAHRTGLENLQEQARLAKERWLGNLQMRHFRATRTLPLDLRAADEAYADYSSKLGGWQVAVAALERKVRGAFRGYWTFGKLIKTSSPDLASEPQDRFVLFAKLQQAYRDAEERLAEFQKIEIPRYFSFLPPQLLIPLLVAIPLVSYFIGSLPLLTIGSAAADTVLLGAIFILHQKGRRQSQTSAEALSAAVAHACGLARLCHVVANSQYQEKRERLQREYDQLCAELAEKWEQGDAIESRFAVEIRDKIEAQAPRLLLRNQEWRTARLERNQETYEERQREIAARVEPWRAQTSTAYAAESSASQVEEEARWTELKFAWEEAMNPLLADVAAMQSTVADTGAPWDADLVEHWTPPAIFSPAIQLGGLVVDLATTPHPRDSRLRMPEPAILNIPLALSFPSQGSLLFETSESGAAEVAAVFNNAILRLLTHAPPGKLNFTILDPVGLGQNFAGLMHLTDFEESLINRRIWTQREQIEERLAELNEHIEKVIQMYLRNEYETITEYNAQAGSVAEKYHFLVVSDFPANFSETAAKRLQSIVTSGPRCGVFTFLHWDRRQPVPDGFVPEELRKNAICLRRDHNRWIFPAEKTQPDAVVALDPPPRNELAVDLVHKIGQSSIDSNRVEVPFSQIAPGEAELWTGDTTSELKVAIGRTGATKLQYLAIGKGTRQHALFAGKTGSGKSTLFHVIITNLSLWCSPEQVEFYLIDFKKGVEFKCYAEHRLPHAKVVAIESDREFGLSVLQRVDLELKRRGDMFRKLGVQDIAGYKRAGGTEPVPRTLLIIDEFQEFFVEDDEIAQTASLLFDRIVRQGRAFGIHVLLGSQTLGGAYTLARATLGQMVIRVALQCSEADAYLIMDDNNPAPRLLSRPGEGIYNDAAGAIEGNSPFQVVWLSDSERDTRLEEIRTLAEERKEVAAPIVFEGNAPADLEENVLLKNVIAHPPVSASPIARVWLGAPNSIKGPTEVGFQNQSGSHLLIVGQNDEAISTMMSVSLLALAAQHAGSEARYVFLTPDGRGSLPILDSLAAALGSRLTVVQNDGVKDAMLALSEELAARSAGEGGAHAEPVYVFIHHLERFKKLRNEDDFSFSSSMDATQSPAEQLKALLSEGSSVGIHVLASIDTFNNVGRFLSRKALGEFEMRVVFQMSANDSASLIDSPQASALGLHRAILYNEHNGSLETFRPYAAPENDWVRAAVQSLTAASAVGTPAR